MIFCSHRHNIYSIFREQDFMFHTIKWKNILLTFGRQKKIEVFWVTPRGTSYANTSRKRSGAESTRLATAENLSSLPRPITSLLCTYPLFTPQSSPRDGSRSSHVPLFRCFYEGFLVATSTFFVLIIILRHILAERNKRWSNIQ